MNKCLLLFIIICSLFYSCETELDINSDWEEITVVYGLLDQTQSHQYIRVNKAFLGKESAMVMASIADSINYNPNDIEVKIDRVSSEGIIKDTRYLSDTLMIKDFDSLGFSSDNNIIFFTKTDEFFKENFKYKITVTNLISGKIVTSETKLIYDFNLMPTLNNPAFRLSFVNGVGGFSNPEVTWDYANNASIYQMSLILHFTEYFSDGSSIIDSIIKTFPVQSYSSNSDGMSQIINGQDFFNFISYNIIEKPSVINRRINDVDLSFSLGGSALNSYIKRNEPPTGIVQERDLYTNIENGVGLFSCRYTRRHNGLKLNEATKEAIADQLENLNFEYP